MSGLGAHVRDMLKGGFSVSGSGILSQSFLQMGLWEIKSLSVDEAQRKIKFVAKAGNQNRTFSFRIKESYSMEIVKNFFGQEDKFVGKKIQEVLDSKIES